MNDLIAFACFTAVYIAGVLTHVWMTRPTTDEASVNRHRRTSELLGGGR